MPAKSKHKKSWLNSRLPKFTNKGMAEASVTHGMHNTLEDAHIELSLPEKERIEKRKRVFKKRQRPSNLWTKSPVPKPFS